MKTGMEARECERIMHVRKYVCEELGGNRVETGGRAMGGRVLVISGKVTWCCRGVTSKRG